MYVKTNSFRTSRFSLEELEEDFCSDNINLTEKLYNTIET